MKATVTEYDGCFSIDLQAETMSEAATLVRMGMNRTEKIHYATSTVEKNGGFNSSFVFKKSKRANNDVPKRK